MHPKMAKLTALCTQKLLLSLALLSAVAVAPHLASAADARDAIEFREFLRSVLSVESKSDHALNMIHMIPDEHILSAASAESVEEALLKVKQSSLVALTEESRKTGPQKSMSAEQTLSNAPLTIVIVPGIFGEFIKTRAFEEVLSKPSEEREAFKAIVDQALSKNDPNAKDSGFDMVELAEAEKPLNELIHMGSLQDSHGRLLARVILFYTPFMSLESMGSLEDHAAKFNRRLAKYLALTGNQKLMLIGYSRGTDLALEMLAQAKSRNLPWLTSTQAMVSLGGVAWGSNLADDALRPGSALNDVLQAVRTLRDNVDPDSWVNTGKAWAVFSAKVISLLPKLMHKDLKPKSSELKSSPISVGTDPRSILTIIRLFFETLGLRHPIKEFDKNVVRFRRLVDAALDGVGQLTSKSRLEWWKIHELPKNVVYYSITGAMANPELSDLDKTSFYGPFGYSKLSYDDLMLLQNRLDYESLSQLTLNDSQVSVAQAMILPNAAAKVNPKNAGLKSAFLGTVGTHHWGLALRVVNAMKDGRTNPFPREALLKALAAKVTLDADRMAEK